MNLLPVLLVVPLVHKYKGDRILPKLSKVLKAKNPDAVRIRTPVIAQLLVAHHMEAVVESWSVNERH